MVASCREGIEVLVAHVSRLRLVIGLLALSVAVSGCAGLAIRSQLMRSAGVGSAEVLLGTRVGAVALSRAVPAAMAERHIAFTIVESGKTLARGSISRVGSRALVRDGRGSGVVETVREGSTLRHVNASGRVVGRSRIGAGGTRIDHFELDGSREVHVGFDEIVGQGRRIRHYDGSIPPRLLGESDLFWEEAGGQDVALTVALAVIAATVATPERGAVTAGTPAPTINVRTFRVLDTWVTTEVDGTGYPANRISAVTANWTYGGQRPEEDAYGGQFGLAIRYDGKVSDDYFQLLLTSDGTVRYQSYCHLSRALWRNLFDEVFVCWYGPGQMPKPGGYVLELRDRWGVLVTEGQAFAVRPR